MAKIGKKYLNDIGLSELVGKIKTRYVRTESDNTQFTNVDLTGYTTDITDKSSVMIGVKSADNSENIVKQSTVTIGGKTLSVKETKDADGKVIKREYSQNILVTEKAVADLFEDLSEKIAAEGAVMEFKGKTDISITDGSTTAPTDIYGDPTDEDYKGPENGDVVVYNNEEFVWNNGSWHEIGQVFNSEAIQNINGTLAIKVEDTKDEKGNVVEGSKTIKLIINDTHAKDKDGNITDWHAADTNYGHIHLSQGDSGLKAEYGAEIVVVAETITGKEIDDMFN
jgi:hypothetical protein